jgi:hypothetical protein
MQLPPQNVMVFAFAIIVILIIIFIFSKMPKNTLRGQHIITNSGYRYTLLNTDGTHAIEKCRMVGGKCKDVAILGNKSAARNLYYDPTHDTVWVVNNDGNIYNCDDNCIGNFRQIGGQLTVIDNIIDGTVYGTNSDGASFKCGDKQQGCEGLWTRIMTSTVASIVGTKDTTKVGDIEIVVLNNGQIVKKKDGVIIATIPGGLSKVYHFKETGIERVYGINDNGAVYFCDMPCDSWKQFDNWYQISSLDRADSEWIYGKNGQGYPVKHSVEPWTGVWHPA